MIELADPIAVVAFSELMISCQVSGCLNVFSKSVDVPATDPVNVWSESMAASAREMGWSAGSAGQVLCPIHAHLAEQKK